MNWEHKLQALKSIAPTHLEMRSPGDWYVAAQYRSVAGDGFLRGEYGNGSSPEDAVNDDWRKIAESLPSNRYIQLKTKKVRWNGFMWEEVVIS